MCKIPLGIRLGVLLLSPLTFLSCQHKEPPQNHISLGMKSDPSSLDPREVRLLAEINLIKQMYEGLVQENPKTNEIEPALAESYTISEDKTTYTFHLRKANWSDGSAITAQDFVDSWKQVVSQEVTGIYAFALFPLKNAKNIHEGSLPISQLGCRAIDSTTLEVVLEKPTAHFLKLLSLPIFFPVHKKQRSSSPSALPITSSAFYPEQIKHHQWLTLKKNPHYYNHHHVQTQTITIHFIPDANTASLLFNQGKLDWQGPPWGDRIPLEAQPKLKEQGYLQTFDVDATHWLIFNLQKFPLNHHKLRKALALAIDKDAIVASLFLNSVKPAQHLLPTHIHSYPEENSQEAAQKKRLAKHLFKEALQELNISEDTLQTLNLTYSLGGATNLLLAQMIRNQWKETLGFTLPLEGKEFALLQKDFSTRNFSLSLGNWYADFSDPMAFLSIFAYPSGISPYAINHTQFLECLLSIEGEHDPKLREAFVSQATSYLENLNILEPIYHDSCLFALNKNFHNLQLSSTGAIDMRYVREP